MINIWNMVIIQIGNNWYVQSVNTLRLLKIQLLEILDQSEHPNKIFAPPPYLFCLKQAVIMFIIL